MMANGAFAAAAPRLSARLVAGVRRGAPAARHTGASRASSPASSRRSAADQPLVSLRGRSPASRVAAVREPAGDARRAELASTSFGPDEARRDEQGSASADAARRVRAAKSAASRYDAGDANPAANAPGSAAGGSGDTDASSDADDGGGGPGASRAPGGRGAGGSRPATNERTKPKKIDYRLRTRARTKYNRPRTRPTNDRGGVSETVDMDDLIGDEDAPRASSRRGGGRDSNVWLSNRHTKRPGQQPQQRRRGGDDSQRRNSRKGGMRPGERIVAALQKVPGELLDGVDRLERGTTGDERVATRGARARASNERRVGSASESRSAASSSAAAAAGSYDLVDSAVTRPLGSRARFSAPTLNFAIKELGERGDFSRAHALFLWMRAQRGTYDGNTDANAAGELPRANYRPNRHTLASLFGAASEPGHAKTIVKTWRDAVRLDPEEFRNSEVASAAIAALARCENWPAALQTWRDLGDAGEPRNAYCYTAILSCLKDHRRWEEARDVFRAMRDEPGCAPDATCAGLTLAAFDGARRWREGVALAKRLADVYGVAPEERLTHAVISLAGKAGDTAYARVVLDCALRDRAHVVTTYTYNCLLGGYARNADWEGASAAFAELKRARFVPDAYTYTHLISAAERAGEHAAADDVWQEAVYDSRSAGGSRSSSFKPHTVMCGAYVHCLGAQGRWMEAEAIVAKMRDEWGVARNAALYNALLGALTRGDEVEKALDVFSYMQSEEDPKVLPTEISFMILTRACVDAGLARRAAALAETRDALAQSGALENDFSKYDSRDADVRASAFASGGDASYGRSVSDARASDASAVDAGRLAAGLPPRQD